jgi:hypothetical protein
MAPVADSTDTWLVLLRDVSRAIRVRGHSQLKAGLVLDVNTGLVRGLAVAPTDAEALTEAFSTALSKPAGTLPPGRPDRVLCGPGLAEPVIETLESLTSTPSLAPITEVQPAAEAEDIFDSFIGHMAGRAQPQELPAPEDWRLLFDQTLRFVGAAPWARWHDGIDLAIEVVTGGETTRHAAVVMGNAGLQHGLVLYPGDAAPAGLKAWEPSQPGPTPSGTLLCLLDAPGESPPELTAKALRYGWPEGAELFPAFVAVGPDENGGDPARIDVHRLTVAMAAVIAHDARGPVVAQPTTGASTGQVPLTHGQHGSFTIHQRPPPDDPALPRFRVHQAGFDLVPEGTPVVLGHASWSALPELRHSARLHRPAPTDAPVPAGNEVPLVAVLPKRRHGDGIAAKIAELDPYGIAIIDTDDGQAVVTVVGGNGAEMLMEVAADSAGLAAFRRRLSETKGRHVVMIADRVDTSRGDVYGLFECHQPPPPAREGHSPRGSKPRRTRRLR